MPTALSVEANQPFMGQLEYSDTGLDKAVFKLLETPDVLQFAVNMTSDGHVVVLPPMMWTGTTGFRFAVVQLDEDNSEIPELNSSAWVTINVSPTTSAPAPLVGVVTPKGLIFKDLTVYDAAFAGDQAVTDVVGLSFDGSPVRFEVPPGLTTTSQTAPSTEEITAAILAAHGCSEQDRSTCDYPWSNFDMALGLPLVATAIRATGSNTTEALKIGGRATNSTDAAQPVSIAVTRCAPHHFFTPPESFCTSSSPATSLSPTTGMHCRLGLCPGQQAFKREGFLPIV
jgi:hypothetical protein